MFGLITDILLLALFILVYLLMKRESRYLPFIREVHRIIKDHPEYADGIKAGVVGIRFLAGYSPFEKRNREKVTE